MLRTHQIKLINRDNFTDVNNIYITCRLSNARDRAACFYGREHLFRKAKTFARKPETYQLDELTKDGQNQSILVH